jgi:integrase
MTGIVRKRGSKWVVVIDLGEQPARQCPRCRLGGGRGQPRTLIVWDPEVRRCRRCGSPLEPTTARRREQHSGFATRREAEATRANLVNRVNEGAHVSPQKLTVGDFLQDRWLPAIKSQVRESTFVSYSLHVRAYLAPNLGTIPVQRLTADSIDRMYTRLLVGGGRDGRPLSKRTVELAHVTLSKALSYAVDKDLLSHNVAKKADRPTPAKPAMKAWTAGELGRFFDFADEHDGWLTALWILEGQTGARRGEIAGARWDDFDLDAGRWKVTRTRVVIRHSRVVESDPKTDAGKRIIYLDPWVVSALREHERRQRVRWMELGIRPDHGLVFTDELGVPLHPDAISARFRRLVKKTGLPKMSFHGIRHTVGSVLAASGENPEAIRKLLGHENVRTTLSIYTHAFPEEMQRTASRLRAAVGR